MRSAIVVLVLLFPAIAQGADSAPKVTGALHGKQVKWPEKGVAEGVKATVGLLQSCQSESLFDADELKKALEEDHVRLVLPKPMTAEVLDEKINFSELEPIRELLQFVA